MTDIGRVPHHQHAIHDRLVNWAMYVKPGQSVNVSPMFRQCKSNAFQWHAPEYRPTCDTQDGHKVEKAICKLPAMNKDALVWYYLYRFGVLKARKLFGLTEAALDKLVIDSRTMLANRLGNTVS